ncbi:hypothetical protein BH09BAC5_BH09BAC5_27960 [soil metagenome]
MKKLLFPAIALLFFSCSNHATLVGSWVNNDSYSEKKTIFNQDGSLTVIKGNDVKGSTNEELGQKLSWETDETKTPHWLTYVLVDTKSNETIMTIKGIYEFLDDNTVRICFNSEYNKEKMLIRPTSFDEGETKVLKRDK